MPASFDRTPCRIPKFNARPHYWRHKRQLHLRRAPAKRGRSSMTPQERQMVDDLFDRLSKTESAPRDPDAVAAIAQGLRVAPNAIYALVQTVLVQDEALKRANSRIQELETANAPARSGRRRLPRFNARHDIRTKSAARLGSECAAARSRQPSGLEQRPGVAADAISGTA